MNSFAPINPALIDVALPFDGYVDDGGNTIDVLKDMCGSASRDFPRSMYIEPKDREDKARDNDKYNTWGHNYVDRFTNQNPTHECTCHSLRTNAEAARNRHRGIIFLDGPKKNFRYPESSMGSVWLSALSIYSEANPRKWGGANVREVLEIACRRGFLPDKIQPKEYGFKHDLIGTNGEGNSNQSNGDWVALNKFPTGWQDTAKHFKPLEVVFPASFDEAICLLLNGILVSVGRNGHAVPWSFINYTDSVIGYIDSYNVVRYDSFNTAKRAWSGAFAIVTMTTPDDWLNPAGN